MEYIHENFECTPPPSVTESEDLFGDAMNSIGYFSYNLDFLFLLTHKAIEIVIIETMWQNMFKYLLTVHW